MLSFKIIEKCFQDASRHKDVDVDFLLEENDWNDYWYKTSYHLHATPKLTKSSTEYLGEIKIMKYGQTTDDIYLLRQIFPKLVFEELPEDFCSISFSVDLYRSVTQYLTQEKRLEFIKALHLIFSEDDKRYQDIKEDECFNTSLLRGASMDSFELKEGYSLLMAEGNQYSLADKEIVMKYNDADEALHLNFKTIKSSDAGNIQDNVIAFIGKNGSGKSTALYKLASILYTNPSNRFKFEKAIGKLEPADLGISQLMIFSYNPFDNFTLPGARSKTDLMLWAKKIEERKGRFIFCGMRDVKAEADEMVRQHTENECREERNEQDEDDKWNVRSEKILLKQPDSLSEESRKAYNDMDQYKSKEDEWKELIRDLRNTFPDVYEIVHTLDYSHYHGVDEWGRIYNSLSTGHKFFVHTMLHIIAYCEPNALLMFDEPENHLQSPLLSFMMNAIKKILRKRKSVMLVATHSPVILQELMSANVRIVTRANGHVSFRKPIIETFGGEIGEISSEVFGLNTDRTYFFDKLDKVYTLLDCNRTENATAAVNLVRDFMGGISSQGVHYVVSRYLMEKD